MMKSYKLRIASKDIRTASYRDDITRILEFFENNRDEGNRIRPPEQIAAMVEENLFHMIEEKESSEIKAVAGSLFHNSGDHLEACATRIILNGFRLQRLLHATRIYRAVDLHWPAKEYFSVVAAKNTASLHNTIASGFSDWVPSPNVLASTRHHSDDIVPVARARSSAPKAQKIYLHLQEKHISVSMQFLKNALSIGGAVSKSGEKIDIDFEIDFNMNLIDLLISGEIK